MLQADFAQFRAVLQGVFALYGKDMSPAVMDIWWGAMRPFDLAAFRDVMNRHATDPDRGQFLPKPADVIRLMAGSTQDSALIAWAKVDRAVRSVGTYASVVFDDPIIHAVIVDMGGWVSMGQRSEDEWPFVAREFENRYRGYRTRGTAGTYPRTLTGLAESSNALTGFKTQPPVLIGNEQAAQAVLAAGSTQPKLTWRSAGEQLPSRAYLARELEKGDA